MKEETVSQLEQQDHRHTSNVFKTNDIEEQPVYYSNLDLENIITPVKVQVLVDMLKDTGYPKDKTDYLIQGFTHGFDIGYRGPNQRTSQSKNLPLRVGSKTQLWNKLMKEVKLNRVAGPFKQIPFEDYIQSPIGLVPKGGPGSGKTRLIFHLSYDFDKEVERSMNYYTLDEECTVSYNDVDHTVRCYLRMKEMELKNRSGQVNAESSDNIVVFAGTSDVESAFRLVPLKKACWKWLIMKAQDPRTGKWYYFVDKCLPFGTSISCAIFQKFSDAIKYIFEVRSKAQGVVTNYLDDFLFLALTLWHCNWLISQFLQLCALLGVPILKDKMVWANEIVIFLGLLLDGRQMIIRIPLEKRQRAIKMLQNFIDRKKATVKEALWLPQLFMQSDLSRTSILTSYVQ